MSDKRNAILQATLKLVSQHGFHGTSMAKIAAEAGVSAGIIYHYFKSKDDVMNALYRDIGERLGDTLQRTFDPTQPLETRVRHVLGVLIRYYLDHPLESAFIEQYTRSPYYTPTIEAETRHVYEPVWRTFEEAEAANLLKPLPPSVIQAFTLHVATGLAQRLATGFLTLHDEDVERIVEAAWDAIRRHPTPHKEQTP
nr:TetR/AcrR family transcriptional regulator [Ardenticatena sp.]